VPNHSSTERLFHRPDRIFVAFLDLGRGPTEPAPRVAEPADSHGGQDKWLERGGSMCSFLSPYLFVRFDLVWLYEVVLFWLYVLI